MISFLESNSSAAFGLVVLALVLGLRLVSRDERLRSNLSAALALLGAFVSLRLVENVLLDRVAQATHKIFTLLWMLALAWALVRVAVSLALWVLRFRRQTTPKILQDLIDFVLYALVSLPILKSQLDVDVGSLIATSAVLSLVLGLALQDTLGNLFAGLSIQLEHPFVVGDFVRIRGTSGRVKEITWRAIRLETNRGESVTLPNSILSKEEVVNYSRGDTPVAFDLPVGLAYETAPNTVRALILSSLKELPFVLPEPPPVCRVGAFDQDAIRYTIRCRILDYADVDQAVDHILSRLWYRLRREHVEVPFSQRTLSFKETRPPEPSPDKVASTLRGVDLFGELSDREVGQLAREATPRHFGAGETILEEGTPGETFYLVVRGEVSIRSKEQAEVTRLGPGLYFGEMSLLTGAPRAATVVSTQDTLLLEFARLAFSHLFESHPGFAEKLSELLGQRRGQLAAASEPAAAVPEASRILDRLRQIFRLRG